MTREEYEKLLKSDYWKGYSYSLIKERDFTCQDCGRRFYNERNKLQVHHLVYRDINPWSYNPDEVVVLCESCHKKRHGIIDEPKSSVKDSLGSYSRSYSYSNESQMSALNGYNYIKDRFIKPFNSKFHIKTKHVLAFLFLILLILSAWEEEPEQEPAVNVMDRSYEAPAQNEVNFITTSPVRESYDEPRKSASKEVTQPNKQETSNVVEDTPVEEQVAEDVPQTDITVSEQPQTEKDSRNSQTRRKERRTLNI